MDDVIVPSKNVCEGLVKLEKVFSVASENGLKIIVVPSQMENEIIMIAHKQGHFAAKKTQDLVEKSYFIPKLKEKVVRVVDSCVECIVFNSKAGKNEGFLTPIEKGDRPFMTYDIDHV